MDDYTDKELLDLIALLSEKTSALLHHLRSKDIDRSQVMEMEKELSELQQQIREKTDALKRTHFGNEGNKIN